MYIQCSTVKRKGKDGRNRKLVESYRDPITKQPRNRTIQTLEGLPILERSRIIFKHGGQRHLDPEEWQALAEAGDLTGDLVETELGDSYRGAGNWVILRYLKESGLDGLLKAELGTKLGNVISDLIALQILDPDSKLSYVHKRANSLGFILGGKRSYTEDTFYRGLDELDVHFDQLRQGLNAAHPPQGKLLLYDLSNSYFCGSKAELGGYGASKEKRYDRHIVSYGLVTSEDLLPLDIKVWKGGTADVATVGQTFAGWKQRFHSQQAIWIADRSMSGEPTIAQITQMGLSYITGMPPASQSELLSRLHEDAPEMFDQELTEFTAQGKRYVLCRHDKKGFRKQAQNHKRLRKVYTELNRIKGSPRNKDKNTLYHRAMKVLEKHQHTQFWTLDFDTITDKKAVVRYQLKFTFHRDHFTKANLLGHYYVLQTDVAPQEMPAQQVQSHYKELIQVEHCFRQLKSHMEIRPIRHRKAERIRGHIYLNYLCLWLVKYIEKQWRQRGQTSEVVPKLKQWNTQVMLHEILDKKTGAFVELQWNKGPIAKQALQEMTTFGEMKSKMPHL